MRCPICNREMPEGSRKCSNCGTQLKVLFTPEHKSAISTGTFLICIFLALVIGIGTGFGIGHFSAQQPTISAPSLPPSTVPSTTAPGVELQKGYIRYTAHIDSYYNQRQAKLEPLTIFYNDIRISTSVTSWNWIDVQRSFDGKTCVMLSEDGCLYTFQDRNFRFLSDKVTDFRLSADGSAVAYTTMDNDTFYLYYRSFQGHTSQLHIGNARPDYCLSPGGDTLAYIDPLTHELLIHDNKETQSRGFCNGNLVGISDAGEYIYTLDSWYLYCITPAKTQSYKCNGTKFYFNADHRQLLFEYQSQTYICGVEDGLFLQQWPTPFLPSDCITCISTEGAITLPLYDLYGHPYTALDFGETDIYFVTRSANRKICRGGKPITFSSLNNTVYYSKGDRLYRCILVGDFVSTLVIDGISSQQPCYVSDIINGDIFYSIGSHLMFKNLLYNKEAVEISDSLRMLSQGSATGDAKFIHTYALDRNGHFYYIERGSGSSDSGTLYLYKADGNPIRINYNIKNMYVSPNGMVFAMDDTGKTYYLNGDFIIYAPVGEPDHLGTGNANS